MGLKFFMEIYMIVMWVVIYIVNHRVGQEAAEKLSSILVLVQAVLALFILFNFGWEDRKTKYERSCGL
jgi:cyanate permease